MLENINITSVRIPINQQDKYISLSLTYDAEKISISEFYAQLGISQNWNKVELRLYLEESDANVRSSLFGFNEFNTFIKDVDLNDNDVDIVKNILHDICNNRIMRMVEN